MLIYEYDCLTMYNKIEHNCSSCMPDFMFQLLSVTVWSIDWSISSTNFRDNSNQYSDLHLHHCSCVSTYQGESRSNEAGHHPQTDLTHNIQHQWGNVSLWYHMELLHSNFLCPWSPRNISNSLYNLQFVSRVLCVCIYPIH